MNIGSLIRFMPITLLSTGMDNKGHFCPLVLSSREKAAVSLHSVHHEVQKAQV